jgi:hypothetical protein
MRTDPQLEPSTSELIASPEHTHPSAAQASAAASGGRFILASRMPTGWVLA